VLRSLAPRHLLQFECVAVRIGEVCSFNAAPEVMDFADLYTSADKLGTRLGDVLHNQVQASNTAGFSRVHIQPCPKTDRTTRALWCQLDDPDALAGLHVKVLIEAELVSIEGDGSVHVRNRERDKFQPHLHRIRAFPWPVLVRAIIPYGRRHPLTAASRARWARERLNRICHVDCTSPGSVPCWMNSSDLVPVVSPLDDKILRLAVAAHLARYKGQSRTHTASDLNSYLFWCLEHDLAPLEATRVHVELYLRWMQKVRRLKPSTVSRRLSVPSGFYRTCVTDGLLEHSPAEYVRRPHVPPESPTLGLSHLQLRR
jgi:hypothetical protein